MGTAVESIYRNLEYARSLIKRRGGTIENAVDDGEEDELLTSEEPGKLRQRRQSGYSSSGSTPGAASEDWSVISDGDDRPSSASPRRAGKTTRL